MNTINTFSSWVKTRNYNRHQIPSVGYIIGVKVGDGFIEEMHYEYYRGNNYFNGICKNRNDALVYKNMNIVRKRLLEIRAKIKEYGFRNINNFNGFCIYTIKLKEKKWFKEKWHNNGYFLEMNIIDKMVIDDESLNRLNLTKTLASL